MYIVVTYLIHTDQLHVPVLRDFQVVYTQPCITTYTLYVCAVYAQMYMHSEHNYYCHMNSFQSIILRELLS